MRNFDFLGDDGLVDALLVEIAGLLQTLITDGRPGSIDLTGLPLSPGCLDALRRRLGTGEVSAVLNAAGTSEISETAFPGVWWCRHADETGRVAALLIEVAFVPLILCADVEDMRSGHRRLLEAAGLRWRRKSA